MRARRFFSARAAIAMVIVAVALLAVSCSTSVAVDSPDLVDNATDAETDEGGNPTDNTVEAAAPTPTGTPGISQELQSTFDETTEARRLATLIRQVDFRNGFTYDVLLDFEPDSDGATETATVVDGSFENGEFGTENYYQFYVAPLAYGDLDGDGVEEAVVKTSWNGGGSGFFDSVRVYRLVDGEAERAGVVNFGDRAFGGVQSVRIEDGTVRVWSFVDGAGACCPNQIGESTLLLGEHSLVEAERTAPVTFMPLDTADPERELKFLPNTNSAWVSIDASQTEATVAFEAAAGQRFKVDRNVGDNPYDVILHDLTTGEVFPGFDDNSLPSTGRYEVTFPFFEDREGATMLEIIIGYEFPRVTWTTAVDQVLLDEDPFVRTSVTWPIFESVAPGTDEVNEVLVEFAIGLEDAWIANIEEFQDPQGDSSYEATYDVDLVADDLVSVNFVFFDYVCCRPYPYYGQQALVLDLDEGRVIPIEEILDLSRIGEINKLWFAELPLQSEIPADAIVQGEDFVRFDSLRLTAEGVEFGTNRASLGGGLPGTQTILRYEVLGDLVNADLLERISK